MQCGLQGDSASLKLISYNVKHTVSQECCCSYLLLLIHQQQQPVYTAKPAEGDAWLRAAGVEMDEALKLSSSEAASQFRSTAPRDCHCAD